MGFNAPVSISKKGIQYKVSMLTCLLLILRRTPFPAFPAVLFSGNTWRKMPEADVINKFFALVPTWGETAMEGSSTVASVLRHHNDNSRSGFKVDMPVVLWRNSTPYDVADVESAKKGSVVSKTTLDHMKLVVEGKCAFDPLVKECDLSFGEAKCLKIDWKVCW
ncbi:hypothetical protein BJV82DRAFT_79123 [Fennellomyces sp. T-0311]|nr:hypothetical protein BJV82DRAFT_79123 [Fennellomyces sp. T-0311]